MRVFRLAVAAALAITATPALADRPGTLVDAQPMAGAPSGAQAWRIRYWTLTDRGAEIAVTGVVVAPRGGRPASPRPVIAWTHGAWGVAERCAPSLAPNFFAATPGLEEAVARGFTVVAPDYPGLGSATTPVFLVGVDTARSVLDGVRAARSIPQAWAGRTFAVWGESQGGHAALWTGQIARRYAPDLTLVGVAAAAPPTDLVQNLTAGSDPSVRAFLTAFAAYSWSQHYGAPLATLGNRSTQGIITRLARNNCISLTARPRIGTVIGILALRRDLRNVDLGRIQPWARIARDNSPAAVDYGVPVLIAQNPNDRIVGTDVTRSFARRLCAVRATVRYVTIAGEGHATSARDSTEETLDWIQSRFDGARAPNDCGRI